MTRPIVPKPMSLKSSSSAGCRILLFSFLIAVSVGGLQAASRATDGLQVLYVFGSADGAIVKDRSGAGAPVNLRIGDLNAVRRSAGSLEITSRTIIQSDEAPKRLIEALRKSREITIEAWIQPANLSQSGPARIVTLSPNTGERNFTLGQERDQFEVRVRTTKTDGNGIPSIRSAGATVSKKLTHVVYTRDRAGKARVFIDGRGGSDEKVRGDFSNWSGDYRLGLANELTGDRPWLGTFRLVAVFSRALSPAEVVENFKAGVGAAAGKAATVATARESAVPAPAEKPGSTVVGNGRASRGLLAFYDFSSSNGAVVRDRSDVGEPVDLRIGNPDAVVRSKGSLAVRGKAGIKTLEPPGRIIGAIRRSNELTIEAWISPADDKQAGPARIVTLSRNGNERNFTLGQDGDDYDVRLRTLSTSGNGIPSLATSGGKLKAALTHVVYTRDHSGKARIYLNGKKATEGDVPGGTDNWHGQFHLGLADEISDSRQWKGTYRMVALYSRDLEEAEILQNFRAGPDAGLGAPDASTGREISRAAHHFNTKIAPLISKHCLECHDSSTRKGKLDLSHKAAALAWENGDLIKRGKSTESVMWKVVESNEMPDEREPLSAEEKALLKSWIDSGAEWSLDFIDPATYAHGDDGTHENWLRRLTVEEYIRTVRAATGVDIGKEARELLPRDLRADGFSNTAYNLNVDFKHVEAYAKLAGIIVERMDALEFAARFSKSRDLSTDATMRKFVLSMGKWLLRGPLETREEATYSGIATTVASAGGDYEEAVRYLIEAMLQSPRFIYRIENQKGDGTAWPVGEFELASRMSFIIWGASPDKELMDAAETGELFSREAVAAQVKRMLGDPRAVERSAEFASEWLNLNRLDHMAPSPKKFPNWEPKLAADMRAESLAFFHDVVWKRKRPLSDLFNAQIAYVTPRLARHYGLKPAGEGLSRYDVSSVPGRGGLLTQGSILTIGGDEASMVTRGLFVLHDVLRGVVKDPPAGLDTTPVPTKPGLSQRKIAEDRVQNKSCGGCHSKFEPLAYALEKFDGVGAWREIDEHGNKLREDGEILIPGEGKAIPYKTTAELMDLLAGSDRVRQTITWKLTQFALGRPLGAADAPILDIIHTQAQKNGGTYESLINAIIMSDLVQTTRTERDE